MGDIFEVGSRESNEIGSGEVVGDGDNEEGRGARARVWEGALGGLSIEVNNASPFAEYRARV